MTTYEAGETVLAPPETVAARILRILAKTPVQIFLIFVGVLWLVPTIGLFLTSLLSAQNYNQRSEERRVGKECRL